MADLFLQIDGRFLQAKWDFAFAVFRIVARDYRAVLAGERPQERHRTILIQVASDLLDVETDLFRLGISSPAEQLSQSDFELWDAVVPLVRELRLWRIPRADLDIAVIEEALYRRKMLEERFNAVLLHIFSDHSTPVKVVTAVPQGPSV